MDSILNTGPEKVLEKTLQDLQIRSEVEATMSSMLLDVETTASLQREMETRLQVSILQAQVLQYETALQEARAVQLHQRQEQGSLADTLVEQLWSLSQELGQLRRWKETHETTVTQHDEVIAKLLQAEEQIRVLESRPDRASMPSTDTVHAQSSLPHANETNDVTVAAIAEPTAVNNSSEVVKKDSDVDVEKEMDELLKLEEDVDRQTRNALAASDQAVPESDATETNVASAADNGEPAIPMNNDNPVVALLEEEEEMPTPTLDTLNMKLLTEIFEYLDAVEILNTAQINITMFSRVDALFGLSATEEDPAAGAAAPQAPHAVVSTTSSQPQSAPAASLGSRAPLASSTEPEDSKLPALPTRASANASRRGGIFSLLQARGSGGGNPLAAGKKASSDHPLSAAMTDSMVSKLNDKELGAIFSLTEKLHQREKAVATLTAEKEELAGKLDGTEALKEFLINKVRDVEQSLHKSQEDEMKVAQQISSDQEVIAFLDGRVQELERDIKSLSDERKTIAENMNSLQAQNDKKIEVLGDMLQFERERVSENEREWKATKKLLVKEIKSCRAQLLALQAERDGFREQNERLKKAVLLTNSSTGAM